MGLLGLTRGPCMYMYTSWLAYLAFGLVGVKRIGSDIHGPAHDQSS